MLVLTILRVAHREYGRLGRGAPHVLVVDDGRGGGLGNAAHFGAKGYDGVCGPRCPSRIDRHIARAAGSGPLRCPVRRVLLFEQLEHLNWRLIRPVAQAFECIQHDLELIHEHRVLIV